MKIERVFFNTIKSIEIEISSHCNRSCIYCPQYEMKRERELLPIDAFEKIIKDLRVVKFNGAIAFHKFNEPLLEMEHLCKCIEITKKYLPRAKLELFTNGDLLTRKRYLLLKRKGIDEFHISCHLNENEEWNKDLAKHKVKSMRKKIRCILGKYNDEEYAISFEPLKILKLIFKLKLYSLIKLKKYPTLVHVRSEDYINNGSTRLDSVKTVHKNEIKEESCSYYCKALMEGMYISYKGNVYLCFDCCEGTEEASTFLLGSIYENNIYEIFKNKMGHIQDYIYGETHPNCVNCHFNDNVMS